MINMSQRGLTAGSEGRSNPGDRIRAIESGRSNPGDRKRAIESGRSNPGDRKRAIESGRLKSRLDRRNPPARVEEIASDCD
ncbi:MAG: hypothetical protein JGK04_21835 [Microcoleus sp. PH2017_39_LGB_O_B]|uniref:hypothetical protein n=2 Tax=Microcoleus TaxID=44471 RepID=UPI001D9B5A23|nr:MULTISPECIES: hypothetical protein [unclassified Microcoleus]MCC3631016.1 hypothetical protein [Microcoleus sp. PH2017_39_LGB_O_B]MCC3643228.1 hypothetical protein [Microcoleus sp. PH2017_33_LGB_O_A]